jgi:starch-binding outer membrane protein, SusD/RagB family
MMRHHVTVPRAASRAALGAGLAAAVAAGCGRDRLLDVQTPDQITPEQANSPTGSAALRVAAIGNFAYFYGGDYGGSFHGLNITSGLLSDEMESARGGTEHLDSRAQNDALQPLGNTWASVGQAHTQLIRARRALREFASEATAADKATKATQIAQLHALHGMLYALVAENYCNGVPFANADDESPGTEALTNAALYNRALAQFDSAVAAAGTTAADAAIRNLAAVGRARTLVDLNRYADAAAAAAAVPTSFVYNIEYSQTTVVNAVYDWMNGTLNYAPADREGGNGLPFVSANDPRVTVIRGATGAPTPRAGQDGINHFTQTVFARGDSPVALASGVEARLIEAEAALAANDATTYLARVNAARATRTDLAPLTDPGTATARQDLLFRERAFWFWGTAHRTGDLRRLVRQYGRAANAVFPTGSYFKGGTFGADVTLVPSQAEQNNPEFKGCTDKNP